MISLVYAPGSGGDAIDLGVPKSCVDPSGGMRSRSWAYELGYRDVTSVSYPAREVEVSWFGTYPNADRLRHAADADMANGTPGTITLDGWSQRAYIVQQVPSAYQHGMRCSAMKILLLDGFWWRDRSRHFVVGLDESGLDFDYNHEYDLSFSVGKGAIEVESGLGALPRITFYGPCANPYIMIGGNRYEVDESLQSGYTVTIDATGSRKTVTKSDAYGNVSSIFSKAVRGDGHDAFATIPRGTHEVSWSGSFAFDVTWRELDTEPPWDR